MPKLAESLLKKQRMEGLFVETTQNVTLEYQPASLGDRILAYLLDSLIKGAWIVAIVMLLSYTGVLNSTTIGDVVRGGLILIALVPVIFYSLISELVLNGQSVGKKTVGIKVVMLDGSAPTVSAYLLRWLFRLIDLTLFSGVVAVITVAVNGKGQRLGDLAARTSVVKLHSRISLEEVVAVPVSHDPAYNVIFPEAITLSDRDVTILRTALDRGLSGGNSELIEAAATKAKTLTGIQTNLDAVHFLQTLLRDYTHLTQAERY